MFFVGYETPYFVRLHHFEKKGKISLQRKDLTKIPVCHGD